MGQNAKYSVRADVFRFASQTQTFLDAVGTSGLCHEPTYGSYGGPYADRLAGARKLLHIAVSARLFFQRSTPMRNEGVIMRQLLLLAIVGSVVLNRSCPARAQQNDITCTGKFIVFRHQVPPQLAPFFDPAALILAGPYSCVIARTAAGLDQLRRCNSGENCRVVGVYSRKVGATYTIRRLISVDVAW
jgi:hypothetical protein